MPCVLLALTWCVLTGLGPRASAASVPRGWLNWRGPEQSGYSRETGLPDRVSAEHTLWRADFPGQSAPVIANGKLYAMGYTGQGADLQEGVTCFDAETGQKLWQHLYNDFLSDTIYLRYATASPAIDGDTGNIYMQGTQGILAAFAADGTLRWRHSLMEKFGRLTFPNSRTSSPVIDADLVITRGITANWGSQGPGADRFYAFDKKTGEPGLGFEPQWTAQGQFVLPSPAWLVSGSAGFICRHGGRKRGVRQRAHRRTALARAAVPGRDQCHGARPPWGQSHRHLWHPVRVGPNGRTQDA